MKKVVFWIAAVIVIVLVGIMFTMFVPRKFCSGCGPDPVLLPIPPANADRPIIIYPPQIKARQGSISSLNVSIYNSGIFPENALIGLKLSECIGEEGSVIDIESDFPLIILHSSPQIIPITTSVIYDAVLEIDNSLAIRTYVCSIYAGHINSNKQINLSTNLTLQFFIRVVK